MDRIKGLPKRVLPIITWLPKYNVQFAIRDLIAGLTVGLTVIPQGLAYANLANLPAQYGLYSSFMGVFVYCLLGTSKDITLGPTAIMSMLVAQFCSRPDSWPTEYPEAISQSDPALAVNLTMLTGLILLILGVLNLGFIVNFISHAVIVGFVSAASILISFSQVKKLFGIKLHHREFFEALPELVSEIFKGHINWNDFAMGMVCMALLKGLQILKQKKENDESLSPVLRKVIWLVGTARNAFVVIGAALVAFALEKDNVHFWKDGCKSGTANCTSLTLTKLEDASLPPFSVPMLSYSYEYLNETTSEPQTFHVGPMMIISKLSIGLFIIPLMAYLESIAIAKGFAIKNGYKVNPTQELLAIGLSNSISACVLSYPVTGSFSRSAVNSQSNVATPAGGIVCGSLVLLALLFLTPIFVYIPAACLGAVIILAAISMFDDAGIKHTWKLYRPDMIPLVVCFVVCFKDIAYGIMAGIICHVCVLLYKTSKPDTGAQDSEANMQMSPSQGIYYPAAEMLAERIESAVQEGKNITVDLGKVYEIDSATSDAFKNALYFAKKENLQASVINANSQVAKILRENGAGEFISDEKSTLDEHSDENKSLLEKV